MSILYIYFLENFFTPCSGQEIIYAWAKNAPALTLPPGVGFKVGGPDSNINFLVLQVGTHSNTNI